MGDSNLKLARNIPTGIEVHAVPGLTFKHVVTILSRLQTTDNPVRIVISAGINHRDAQFAELQTELEQLRQAVADSAHEIIFAGVPISNSHGKEHVRNINRINDELKERFQDRFIRPIGREGVVIAASDTYWVHHTQLTTDKALLSIIDFLE